MKFNIILLTITCIFLIGCSKEVDMSEKYLTCTIKQESDDLILSAEYNVVYSNNIVSTIETIETLYSTDLELLEEYKIYLEEYYIASNEIEYYENKTYILNNTLFSISNIDYSQIDVEKFLESNNYLDGYFTDNKLTIDTIKELYLLLGATCE